jgi:HrpA-like RNA helicase
VGNGILRNEAHNGELEKYAQVFIDEAHEFDSNTAYVLVKCLRHIDTAKYAFRLTVMSATISKTDFFVYFQKEPNLMERPPSALRVPETHLLLNISSTPPPPQQLKTDGKLP